MTEEEARDWIVHRYGAAALARLEPFVAMLIDENTRHNLIAPSTVPTIWSRHIVDSAQLAAFASADGPWLDIGSGGGLPGLVLALLDDRRYVLCEPRRLRAEFLRRAVEHLDLGGRVTVAAIRVEALRTPVATITARAVTGLDALLRAARSCADRDTTWILPRGQSGAAEIQASTMLSRATFHVEQSLTDAAATILVARGVG